MKGPAFPPPLPSSSSLTVMSGNDDSESSDSKSSNLYSGGKPSPLIIGGRNRVSNNNKLQASLMASKRISQRSTPSVEAKMTAQGFTIHQLNFPTTVANHCDYNNSSNNSYSDPGSSNDGFTTRADDDGPTEDPTETTTETTRMDDMSSLASSYNEHYPIREGSGNAGQGDPSASVLYGRDEEIDSLKRLVDQCCCGLWTTESRPSDNQDDAEMKKNDGSNSKRRDNKFPLVLITGEAGVGKSALTVQLHKYLKQRRPVEQHKDNDHDNNSSKNNNNNNNTSYFCLGKYDQTIRGIPFAGVHAAMRSLVSQIRQASDLEQERIKTLVGEMLGSGAMVEASSPLSRKEGTETMEQMTQDIAILAELVPGLNDILQLEKQSPPTNHGPASSIGINKAKIHVLFHGFLRAVSSFQHPVILCQDDLQWADVASLELLQALVQEKTIPGLLLVGLYRGNEVSEENPLNRLLKVVDEDHEHIELTRIKIGNLSLPHVKKLLSHILNDQYTSEEKLDRFAEILQRKSNGNPFFMTQLLKQLHRTDALKFNLGTMKWHWDDDEIDHGVNVTDNVASFMEANLQSCLSPTAAWILQIGACLGNSFDESIMISLLHGFSRMLQKTAATKDVFFANQFRGLFADSYADEVKLEAEVRRALEECVSLTFLSKHASDKVTYHFAHDKVQEAATLLIGAERIGSLCHYIGWTLIDSFSSPEQLEEYLFVAVDGINRGRDPSTDVLRKGFELNLQAGMKAMTASAFEAATLYFDEASASLRLIESMLYVSWTDYQILRPCGLELFTSAARAEYCAGNMDGCMANLKEILLQPSIPIEDKLDAYSIQSEALSIQERHTEEFKTTLDVLRQLGVKFPPRRLLTIGMFADLQKTKLALRKMSTRDLMSLPDMQDETRCKTMKLLDRATNVSFMLNDPHLPFLVYRQVRWTARYGVGPTSAAIFCSYAAMLVAMGDFQQAAEFCKVGTSYASRPMCSPATARVLMTAYTYCFHWATSVKSCLKPLLEGHEIGMKNGDLENAFYCAYAYILNGNAAGIKLPIINQDIVDFQRQMFVYHQDHINKMCLPHLQFVLKMMYFDDAESSFLNGEIMEFDALMAHLIETNHAGLQDITRCMQLQLAFYFGNLELAWKMGNESKSTEKTCLGQAIVWRRAFFVGLTNFALARLAFASKNKRAAGVGFSALKKEGNACLAKMKVWVEGGNMNCIHMLRILEGESLSLSAQQNKEKSSRQNDVSSAYSAAIVASSRSGLAHDRGLCYELAASLLAESGGNNDRRLLRDYQDGALSAYEEWGAWAKCHQLKQKWELE